MTAIRWGRLKVAVPAALIWVVVVGGCAHRRPAPVATPARAGTVERGLASWYGEPYHGRHTASGEVYDMYAMTAAHRTLPFDTVVRVTRRDTGAEVKVRINDRGPFISGRIIDLSYAAAAAIGLEVDGVAPVAVEILRRNSDAAAPPPRRSLAPTPVAGATPECLWIQVGAFADAGNAKRAREALTNAGVRAVIVEGPGGLHRVRVGPFSASGAAERALPGITARYPASAIVSCGS